MKDAVQDWPHFSGNYHYPVPSTRKGLSACDCFWEYNNPEDIWTGRYGKKRRELLKYLVEKIRR